MSLLRGNTQMANNTTQGVVLAIFGASAGGHLTGLNANAEANGLSSLAADLSASAGFILGVDLSSDETFTSTVLSNLGVEEGTDGYTLAESFFTTNLAAGTDRGALVASAVEYLLGDNVDASLSTVASAFTTTVSNAVTYSQGEGADVFSVAALRAAQDNDTDDGVDAVVFALTTSDDNVAGSTEDDTFTATSSTLSADDAITDTSTTDNDVFNITATKGIPAMDVSNVEAINIEWDAVTTPTVDLNDVDGATVSFTSDNSGFFGNGNVDNAGSNSVTFGSGFDGTVTIDGIEDATVNADLASTVNVGAGSAADGALTVNAAAATDVTVTGGETLVLNAVAADTLSLTGGDFETIDATLGANVDVTITGASDAVVNLVTEADINIDLADSTFETLAATGAGAVTIDFAEAADLHQAIISGVDTITIEETAIDDTALDLHDNTTAAIVIEDTFGTTADITVRNGVAITAESDLTSDITLQTDEDEDTSDDTVTLTLEADQAGALIVDTSDQEIENLNITVDLAGSDANDTLTLADIQGNSAAGTNVVITSTDSDTDVVITAVDAEIVNGSAIAGEFTITAQTTNEDLTVYGAEDDTTVTFAGTSNDSVYIGGDGADDITIATTSGSAGLSGGAGNDTFTVGGILTAAGAVGVTGGAGNDTVEVTADITAGDFSFAGGDGDDVLQYQTTSTSMTDDFFQQISGVEKLEVTGTNTLSVTLGSHAQAAGLVTVSAGNAANSIDAGDYTTGITVRGGTGIDTITGGSAVDFIYGGAGNDVILAGGGSDVIIGGAGSDQIQFTSNDQFGDNIFGFASGSDVISLDIGGASATTGGTVFAGLFTASATATTAASLFKVAGTASTAVVTGTTITANIFTSLASADAFVSAITAITAATGGTSSSTTGFNFLFMGTGTGGTIWAAIATADDYTRSGSVYNFSGASFTDNEIFTIANASGVAVGDIVLV
jgi:Ca2+-binding RTX toxin-like protein